MLSVNHTFQFTGHYTLNWSIQGCTFKYTHIYFLLCPFPLLGARVLGVLLFLFLAVACGILVPPPGIEPVPLHREGRILTTGQPGMIPISPLIQPLNDGATPMPSLYQASEELIGKAGWELTSERETGRTSYQRKGKTSLFFFC